MQTWGIKVADAQFWTEFEAAAAAMTFAIFVAKLKEAKASALRDAQFWVEKYTPEVARCLKSQVGDVWNSPLLTPKWRDTLGAKVTNAIVRDDSPVLEGKWPVRPSEFPIDPHHEKEANEAVEKWRSEKKRQGLDYAASRPSAPSLTPLCPAVGAAVSFGDGHLSGTLVTFDADVATIALGGAAAESAVFPESLLRIDPYDDADDDSDDGTVLDSALESVPEWALAHVHMQLESDSTIVHQVIVCDDELVVLDERAVVPGLEESRDQPAVEESVALHYTVIAKTHRLAVESPGKAFGTTVSGVEVGTTAGGANVAMLKRQMNGAVLVIEAGACVADHYIIQPPETAESKCAMAIASGTVVEFCLVDEAYAAYKIDVDGSKYWLPVALFVDRADEATATEESNEERLGQIGGDFYVRLANGQREHVATTLKKCQTWIDHASHNRSERFRAKRKLPPGDLQPLAYYARIVAEGDMANFVFKIFTLDKLVKKTEGYSAWLPSAAFDASDVQVQWTEYEQRHDGLYIRTARQSEQEALANMPMAIAMKVTLVEADGVSGGTLSEDSAAALLKLSLIDERAAMSVREITVLVPPKQRSSTQTAPFEFDTSHILTSISGSFRFPGEQPALGDVLLSVNGVHCDEPVHARSHLRRAVADGGRVFVQLWTPPIGWTPAAAPAGASHGTTTAQHASVDAEYLPQWAEEEMRCVVRLSCRMFGGTKDKANIVAMCGALDLDGSGSSLIMQRRIEQELQKRNVPDLELKAFDHAGVLRDVPSQSEVCDRTHTLLNERHCETFFRAPQIVELLRCISAEPSASIRRTIAPTRHGALAPGPSTNPPQPPSFADVQLSQIAREQPSLGVTFPRGEQPERPVKCLPSTARNIPYRDRGGHEFFDRANITIAHSATARALSLSISRTRPLCDDWCPVFEHDDGAIGLVRLRIEDFSRDVDGTLWFHGYPLYSKSQLPSSAAAALPRGFDPNLELVESIDAYQVKADELRGVVRVISTSASRAVGEYATCHHQTAFVEEFDTGKWKITKPKHRPATGAQMAAKERVRPASRG